MRDEAQDDSCVATNLHLWRAVLYLGLRDVAVGDDPQWLRSDDFEAVCHMAGVDADVVREVFNPDNLLGIRVKIIPR